MFSNRRFGYGSATFGYGGGRISRSFMDGISARTSLLGLWSTARRAWSGYSGAILRARRSSDSAERDFFPNGPQGEVSTADVRAWNGWNLATHTEDFSQWIANQLTTSTNATIAPNGTLTADKLVSDVGSTIANTYRSPNYLVGVTNVCSMYLKAAEWTWAALEIRDQGNQTRLAHFDLSNGTVGTVTAGSSAGIESVGNGWYRCWINKSIVAGATSTRFRVYPTNADVVISTGDGTSGIFAWGAQAEVASTPSTYEPRTTTGAGDSFLVTLYEQAENGRNLLARTEEFEDSAWTKAGASVSANTTANPVTGLTTADTLTEDTSTGSHAINATMNLVSGVTYTSSVYVKSNGRTSVSYRNDNDNATFIVNLTDGSVSSPVNCTATAIDAGGGWWRLVMTFTAIATGSRTCSVVRLRNGAGSTVYTGDGASGVLVWGAQLETGTTATTYEKRTDRGAVRLDFTQSTTTLQPIICEQGVPVTENGRLAAKFVAADARRMSIASSTAMFNALHTTGGSVLAVSKANNTAAVKVILRNKSSSNIAGFQLSRLDDERMIATAGRLDVAGVATIGNTIDVGFAGTGSTSQSVIAAVYDPDNAAASSRAFLWQNGSQSATTNASTGTPFVENAANDLTLGAIPGGASPFDGTISEVATFSSLISTADRVTLEDRAGDFYGVAVTQPITITTQPTSKLVTFGEAFTLTCEGTNVQTYNWQFRNAGDTAWSAVGVQTSTLNLVGEAAMNGREYRCVLINPNASATSNTATITAQGIMAKVGTVTSPLVDGNQSTTGIGFTPKALSLFGTPSTVNANSNNASLTFGSAVTSSNEASVSASSSPSVTTSDTARRHDNTKILSGIANSAIYLEAGLQSLDNDGFTLNWVSNSARIQNYFALGGSTLEANLVQCQMNNTNAAQSFAHGLSGAPTAILLFGLVTTSAPPVTEVTIYMSIGAWAGGSQFASAIYAQNGVTTTVTRRYLSSSAIGALLNPTLIRTISISSVDETNINCIYPVTFSSSQSRFYMLCLRGCKAQVGTFDLNSSLSPVAIPCSGITPRLFFPVFVNNGVDFSGSVLTDLQLTIGASDGTATVSCGITDQSGVTTTNTRRFQTSNNISEYNVGGTKLSQMDVSFSGESVIVDASEIGASSAAQGGYLIIGE